MSPSKNRSPDAGNGKALSVIEAGNSSKPHDFRGLSDELQRPAEALTEVHGVIESMAGILNKYRREVETFGEQFGKMQEKDKNIAELEIALRRVTSQTNTQRDEFEEKLDKARKLKETCEEKEKELEQERKDMNTREKERRVEHKQRLQKVDSEKQAEFEKRYQDQKKALEKENEKHIKSLKEEIGKLAIKLAQTQKTLTKTELESENNKLTLNKEIETLKRSEDKLVEENCALKSDLRKIKEDFALDQAKTDEYLIHSFSDMDKSIQDISNKYFKELHAEAIQDPRPIQKCLSDLHPSLACVPILNTKSSRIFRTSVSQYLIMKTIQDFIWQPFYCGTVDVNPDATGFFRAISVNLAKKGGKKESGWRSLHVWGMEPDAQHAASFQDRIVDRMMIDLQPFIGNRAIPGLRQDLVPIVRAASDIWREAQRDITHIYLDNCLESRSSSDREARTANSTTQTSLYLFPKVMRKGDPIDDLTVKELHGGRPFPFDPALLEEASAEDVAFKEQMKKAMVSLAQSMKPMASQRVDTPFSSPTLG